MATRERRRASDETGPGVAAGPSAGLRAVLCAGVIVWGVPAVVEHLGAGLADALRSPRDLAGGTSGGPWYGAAMEAESSTVWAVVMVCLVLGGALPALATVLPMWRRWRRVRAARDAWVHRSTGGTLVVWAVVVVAAGFASAAIAGGARATAIESRALFPLVTAWLGLVVALAGMWRVLVGWWHLPGVRRREAPRDPAGPT